MSSGGIGGGGGGGGAIAGNHVQHRVGRPGMRPAAWGATNPNWPATYSLVGYGDTPASQLAIEYRLERARFRQELGLTEDPWEFSEANVAVITYVDPADPRGTPRMIPMISSGGMIDGTRGEAHSEERLLAALQAQGIPIAWVTEVYTERQPCGANHHNCAHQLAQALAPTAQVTFSVEFGDDPASQQRGLEMLESNWEEQAARARENEMRGEGTVASDARSPEDMGGGSAMMAALHKQMQGDPVAQGILEGMARGEKIGEMRERLGVSQSVFDQARERLRDAVR